MKNIFLIIALVFIALWALAKFVINVAGAFIHILLVIAIIMFIMNMVKPRPPAE